MGSTRNPGQPSLPNMPRNWVAFVPNGLPVITARLGPHRFPALVDTGAARSLIAPTVATDFGFRFMGTDRIIGVTGPATSVSLVEVVGVGIGSIELLPFRAGVLELGHLQLGIQAVLGVNAFTGRRLQIDFSEGRIYLLS
jgi:predicted aspartyl protease